MADYNKFDERVDGLVIETKTTFDPALKELSEADRSLLAHQLHQAPQLASKLHYERCHTGFVREIMVTAEDIQRLYQNRVSK